MSIDSPEQLQALRRVGRLVTEADGWTVSALDGSPSAHEEHTIVIADGGPVVLTYP